MSNFSAKSGVQDDQMLHEAELMAVEYYAEFPRGLILRLNYERRQIATEDTNERGSVVDFGDSRNGRLVPPTG